MSSANPKPLMTVQVGQAGVQIGHAVWELFCLEHNICIDGTPKLHCGDLGNVETVFVPTPKGRYFPRSLFVDTDPSCIDEIRSGPYQQLFSSRQLLSDQIDSASNYTTGRYGYAKRLLPDTLERLRWMTEKADAKPTLCLVHSACGGTGSGFSVACMTKVSDELGIGSQNIIDLCVVPGSTAGQSSCELLNTALYLDESQELTRQTLCVSNSALFRLCNAQLQSQGAATFAHANRALAAAFSNLTATERMPGSSVSLSGILDSLLPFRHLRYPLLACAPFLTAETARTERPTAKTATAAVLELGSQFLDVDLRQGRHAAGFLLYRGGAGLTEAQKLAAELTERNRVQFHDWAPSGFRAGVVAPPPVAPPGSGFADVPVAVTLLASHSGISGIFAKLAASAQKLQDRDMFVHNYEGAIVALLNRGPVDGAGLNRPAGTATTAADSESQQAPSAASASADNNSVRQWMNPTAVGGGRGELQEYLRRRLPSKEPLQEQQEGEDVERQVSRTCALSDVFGVRVRLSSAIEYLQQVSHSYAEDCPIEGAGGDDSQVDAIATAVDEAGADDEDEDEEDESQRLADADDEDDQWTTGDVAASRRKGEASIDSNKSTGEQSANSKQSSSRPTPQTQSLPTEPTEQVEPSEQPEPTSSKGEASDTPVNNANYLCEDGRLREAAAAATGSRWCLRRRSKSREASSKHPAIAEAERILMKYQRSLGGQ